MNARTAVPGFTSILLRLFKWLGIVVAAFLILYFGLLLFFDFNRLKEPLARQVYERTGRELRIEGDLDLTPGWPLPRIRAGKVSFSNPGWARERDMFTVEQAEVALSLPRLLARRIHLSEVLLASPVVNLQIASDNRKTWLLDREQRDEDSRIGVGRLRIDEGRLVFYDPARRTDLAADFSITGENSPSGAQTSWRKLWEARDARGDADRSAESGVQFTVKGRYKGAIVDGTGRGGSVFSIRDENFAYPLEFSGRLADAGVSVNGTVNGLTTFAAMDAMITARGRSLDALAPVIGVALPPSRPYQVAGRIQHAQNHWHLQALKAKLGGSDFAGELRYEGSAADRDDTTQGKLDNKDKQNGSKDPGTGGIQTLRTLRGTLTSTLLQLEDLPGRGDERKDTSRRKDPLFPQTRFDTRNWQGWDADLDLKAARIVAGRLPFTDVSLRLRLQQGQARLEPLNARLAGGQLDGSLSLDGSRQPAQGKAGLRLRGVQLAELMPAAQRASGKLDTGRMDGSLLLEGSGASVDALLGAADGRLSLLVDGGTVSNYLLEKVGIDLWEMLKFKIQGDQGIRIRCGVADFGVRKGIAQANLAVLDTEDTKVTITGHANLRDQTLDLTLHPEPKDMSLISLRSPIRVTGPMSGPEIAPDKGRLSARGLGALALAVINPLLALAPLVETGPGLDSDCGQLVKDARALQARQAGQGGHQGSATTKGQATPIRK